MRRLMSRPLLVASPLLLIALALTLVVALGPRLARAGSSPTTRFTTQTRLGFAAGDDWEPALAADRYGHVYALYKHYDVAGQTSCANCDLHVVLQVSADRGKTWSAPVAIDPETVTGGQFDSQIAVDPVDGKTVWASFLQNNKSSIAVMKSTDFGQSWSGPTIVENLQRSTDKDILAVRGQTVAVAYNAAQKIYASISHDGGATWTAVLVNDGSTQLGWSLGGGGAIDSQGNIFFGWDGFTQNGGAKGPVNLFVSASHDGGATWSLTPIGVSGAAYPCDNCGFAFLAAQLTLAVGSDDSVNLLWNSTVDQTNYAPERIYFARSTDHGATYSARQDVSLAPAGVEHCFPAIVTGASTGDVRIAWTDTRTGSWNLYYRSSGNGGASWSGETKVSGYVPGYSYLTPSGFGLPYGDYFQMAVDSSGATQIAWGESNSYAGPGNIWTAHS
ncbi:MAG TPA: sialidase family protein [Ktedonobacterales bacterium]|nr:sialidase family protein [Ktedonobacterales bacterium]